jgi:hypothetical protein
MPFKGGGGVDQGGGVWRWHHVMRVGEGPSAAQVAAAAWQEPESDSSGTPAWAHAYS